MSSMQFIQPPPPPMTVVQQPYNPQSGYSSIGPVIGVLIVITILGIIAVMIGRLCSGRRIMGYGQFDVESWLETKFSSCIDGRVHSSPPARPTQSDASNAGPAAATSTQRQAQQEVRQDEQSSSQSATANV